MTVVLSKKIAATEAVLSSNNQTSKNTDKSGSNKANVTIRKGRPASTKAKSRRGLLFFLLIMLQINSCFIQWIFCHQKCLYFCFLNFKYCLGICILVVMFSISFFPVLILLCTACTFYSRVCTAHYYGRPVEWAGHYIFAVISIFFLFFFPLPNLSGRRLDVYHTSTHGVASMWI